MPRKKKEIPPLPGLGGVISFGADPEVFFINKKTKTVLGAEKVLSKSKVSAESRWGRESAVSIDGLQAELNPQPATCREFLQDNISDCMRTLVREIQRSGQKDLGIDFSNTRRLTAAELKTASKENRVLGCDPSKSVYKQKSFAVKNAASYKVRTTGGHIHIGANRGSKAEKIIKKEPERIVAMLDILLGNTAVMIDKDPSNKERRKRYGRAGEFRTPEHGLEYRTLSNFWLRNYALMSFVFGVAREAVAIVVHSNQNITHYAIGGAKERIKTPDYEKMIRRKANMRDIRRAINNNDVELARKNFQKIRPVLEQIARQPGPRQTAYHRYPLAVGALDEFEFFTKRSIASWFRGDPVKHWVGNPRTGWGRFVENRIRPQMAKAAA